MSSYSISSEFSSTYLTSMSSLTICHSIETFLNTLNCVDNRHAISIVFWRHFLTECDMVIPVTIEDSSLTMGAVSMGLFVDFYTYFQVEGKGDGEVLLSADFTKDCFF